MSLTQVTVYIDRADDEQNPLSILATSSRIHQAMEKELCEEPGIKCHSRNPEVHGKCSSILECYGERPFKCKYPRCGLWRRGFETRTLRERHELAHETPLKCHFAGCTFERIGFLSETMRERHFQDGHSSDSPQATFDIRHLGPDSVEPLLHYLITENQVKDVENILSSLSNPDHYKTQELRMLASFAASPAMLRLFSGIPSHEDRIQCTIQSIKGRNQRTLEANLMMLSCPVQYIPCSFHARLDSQCIVWQLVSSNWVEGMKMWSTSVKQQLESDRSSLSTLLTGSGSLADAKCLLRNLSLLKEAAKHPFGEQTMAILWNDTGLLSYVPDRSAWATRTLKSVARLGCSVTLAAELLRIGASINDHQGREQRSVLHWASLHDSAAGAKMMEFLLFRGADPDAFQEIPANEKGGTSTNAYTKMIRDEKGAKNIQKWLGRCWDDLVEETKHIRIGKQVGQSGRSITWAPIATHSLKR